ncbi:DUF2938 family protein [Roseibium sp. RKSG952]|uniref:DUF2938 family protein n=1 Tax=Roseibium sp. RKSG952 TaxID=2529384 RepID=UPI0012BCF0BC|nr:DUF2938 family protein [Roseibium sp. RKSG952]MTI02653.1 DUF2938 family protein [Roseibium sp. RKSG952]
MNVVEFLIGGAIVGFGATVFTDLVGLLRQGWPATNGFYCLVGRWIGSVPRTGFSHADIRTTAPVDGEAVLGWGAHIFLGLLFGIGFVFLFGSTALDAPKAWQGLSFGLGTVLVPWLIFQPLFGWGVAVSKAPEAWKLRLRSVITHAVFGIGLWLSALALKPYF